MKHLKRHTPIHILSGLTGWTEPIGDGMIYAYPLRVASEPNPPASERWEHRRWVGHFEYKRRPLQIQYATGILIDRTPPPLEILASYATDAQSAIDHSLTQWAEAYGYELDGGYEERQARDLYLRCNRANRQLRAFLGSEYDSVFPMLLEY